jgi:two-component system, cell cycle response regulator CtrA
MQRLVNIRPKNELEDEPMRVLVTTDVDAASGSLALRLSGAAIPFDVAASDDLRAYLKAYDYDVVLLAVRDPVARLAGLRRTGIAVPVMVMTAGEGVVRTTLLNLGADDVVPPGCDAGELVARLRAIVRRDRGHASLDLRAGAAELRLGRMEVVLHGKAVALTPKEYAILELLFLRRGVVHSKPAIVNHVYGAEEGPALRTLDVIVCKLRKKLAHHGAPDLVATVWGSGLTLRELADGSADQVAGESTEEREVPRLKVAV